MPKGPGTYGTKRGRPTKKKTMPKKKASMKVTRPKKKKMMKPKKR